MNILVYFRTKAFEWFEQKKVERSLYKSLKFKEIDQAFLEKYSSSDPFKISKDFLKAKKAPNIYMYGETPLSTMHFIASQCGLSSDDHVIEMGSGRGRGALYLAHYLGCRVVAYEEIPQFVEMMKDFQSSSFEMRCQDMFEADFSKISAVYLYGTMLEDDEIIKLAGRFPKKTKIITVSYPLNAYSDKYITKKTFQGRFPWGKTDIYWNERK